jgi:hypothetical protein
MQSWFFLADFTALAADTATANSGSTRLAKSFAPLSASKTILAFWFALEPAARTAAQTTKARVPRQSIQVFLAFCEKELADHVDPEVHERHRMNQTRQHKSPSHHKARQLWKQVAKQAVLRFLLRKQVKCPFTKKWNSYSDKPNYHNEGQQTEEATTGRLLHLSMLPKGEPVAESKHVLSLYPVHISL